MSHIGGTNNEAHETLWNIGVESDDGVAYTIYVKHRRGSSRESNIGSRGSLRVVHNLVSDQNGLRIRIVIYIITILPSKGSKISETHLVVAII